MLHVKKKKIRDKLKVYSIELFTLTDNFRYKYLINADLNANPYSYKEINKRKDKISELYKIQQISQELFSLLKEYQAIPEKNDPIDKEIDDLLGFISESIKNAQYINAQIIRAEHFGKSSTETNTDLENNLTGQFLLKESNS